MAGRATVDLACAMLSTQLTQLVVDDVVTRDVRVGPFTRGASSEGIANGVLTR